MIRYLILFVAVSASLPSSSAAEPSSSARRWKYDVFLSFRGPDARKGVAFELYDRLHRRGIKTFKDDTDLEVGHPISPTLDATIEESRFAIVILSPNYAFSAWCLEELRKIYECMKDENRILPIFYHVDPSDVRHRRKKSFEEAFNKHENFGQYTAEKVQQWRDAFEIMASIAGWHMQNFRNERELVDAIVDFVCNKVLPTAVESIRDFEVFEQTWPRPRFQEFSGLGSSLGVLLVLMGAWRWAHEAVKKRKIIKGKEIFSEQHDQNFLSEQHGQNFLSHTLNDDRVLVQSPSSIFSKGSNRKLTENW